MTSPGREGGRQKIADSRSTVWTDELTGARNRRYFSEQLAFLQADGVAAVDIDGLKKVNEKFGLRAGDAALRACVRAISASFGCGALVCRYGADIFAVVCHDISQAGFRKCCEDTAEAVRNAEIPGYPEARITVSIGGAHAVGPLADTVQKADQALYHAKAAKNRTVLYKEDLQ